MVNLILEYGIGMRKNWSTDRSTGKREIFTPGGTLVEGRKIIEQLRKLADFVGSPQRKHALEEVQQFYNYPTGHPRIDATTRIAFSLVLIKTTLPQNLEYCRLMTILLV